MIIKAFTTLHVDPDAGSRQRLKQVLLGVHPLNKVVAASTLESVKEKIGSEGDVSIVLIHANYGLPQIQALIEQCKANPAGEDAAYVLIINGDRQTESLLAESVLIGAHSVLFEPYSVDRVTEIVELAAKIAAENELGRKKAAIQLLMSSILTEFDRVTHYLSRGLNVDKAMSKFASKCEALRQFEGESFDLYCQVAVDAFQSSAPVEPEIDYKGASSRIRTKLEAKLKEEYEKEFGGQAKP